MTFPGFPDDTPSQIRIPEQFFRQVLPGIDKLDELKLTLYVFWRLERMEGAFRYMRFSDLVKDPGMVELLGKTPDTSHSAIESALHKAVKRGTLLQAEVKETQEKIICLNSARGRAAIKAIQEGEWRTVISSTPAAEAYTEHPNIFQLYEANIGPLTPMIADALRDAEQTFPENWVEDAFRIAVERNKRNWHYIDAILHRWQEGGRDDRKDQQDRRDSEEARRRYAQWDR